MATDPHGLAAADYLHMRETTADAEMREAMGQMDEARVGVVQGGTVDLVTGVGEIPNAIRAVGTGLGHCAGDLGACPKRAWAIVQAIPGALGAALSDPRSVGRFAGNLYGGTLAGAGIGAGVSKARSIVRLGDEIADAAMVGFAEGAADGAAQLSPRIVRTGPYDGVIFPASRYSDAALERYVPGGLPYELFRMDPRLTVEMRRALPGQKSNAAGYLRDAQHYWSEIYDRYPEAFSPRNLAILAGKVRNTTTGRLVTSPVNDAAFRAVFTQFDVKYLRGKGLVHHHIGGGRFAAGVPAPMHPGSGGIHNVERILGVRR